MTWKITQASLPESLRADRVQLQFEAEGSNQAFSFVVSEADLDELYQVLRARERGGTQPDGAECPDVVECPNCCTNPAGAPPAGTVNPILSRARPLM